MGVATHKMAGEPAEGGPVRTCAATRDQRSVDELLRFVVSPEGVLTPDLACRLPGRGVWVTAQRKALEAAIKSRAFNRSLKRQVKTPPDLADLVEKLLVRRVSDALSIANKAGLVLAGTTKIEAALAAGTPVAIIHAPDAAEDGVARMDRRYAAMARDAGVPVRIVRELTNEQLSLALGRSNVVHAALKKGGAAELFILEAERLRRYRAVEDETIAKTSASVVARTTESNTGKV